MASNEKDIRQSLIDIYTSKYPDSIIRHEFTHDSLSTRNDLFLVDKSCIISFEIKSDKDVLKRLRAQVNEYRTYSSEVVIALDTKHIKAFNKNYGDLLYDNVTVLEYIDNQFVNIIVGTQDPRPNMLRFLWQDELLLLRPKLPRKKKDERRKGISSNKSAKASHTIINNIYIEADINNISYNILKNRLISLSNNKYTKYIPQLTNNQRVLIEEHSNKYFEFISIDRNYK